MCFYLLTLVCCSFPMGDISSQTYNPFIANTMPILKEIFCKFVIKSWFQVVIWWQVRDGCPAPAPYGGTPGFRGSPSPCVLSVSRSLGQVPPGGRPGSLGGGTWGPLIGHEQPLQEAFLFCTFFLFLWFQALAFPPLAFPPLAFPPLVFPPLLWFVAPLSSLHSARWSSSLRWSAGNKFLWGLEGFQE